jgi:hypothetical protein
MANTILIKRNNTLSNVPTAGELSEGELAINTNPSDRKLYSKDSGGTVFQIGAGTVTSVSGTGTVSGLTLTGTVTSSGNLTLGGTLSVAAGDIGAGNLGSDVNTYIAGNGAATSYQVLFGNTTSGTSGATSILKDSAASQFTYNPSTNTFYAANSSSTKVITNGVFLNELASAGTDVTADGQVWVKNNIPNDLYFTGDTGIDYPVAYATYRKTSATALDNANQSLNMGTESVADAMVNGCWYSDNATAYTLTLEDSGTTHFPVGAQMTIWNEGSGTLTIAEGTGTTLYVLTGSAVTDSAGGCTLGQGGYATIIRKSTTVYLIMGAGITP